MRRIALIANPMAGALSAPAWVERARRELWGYEIESFLPSSIEELQDLGARFHRKDYAAALVFGGDGTQNQALRGRWNAQTSSSDLAPLYPFPGGTANDLSAELGLTRSLEQVQRLIDGGQAQDIDVISVNGVPFTTVAGIGAGAALTQAINDTRRESKVFCGLVRTLRAEIYTAMSAKTILTSRSFLHDVKIESDTYSERLKVAAVFVCNQDRLGGDLKVGERNSNRDGVFGVLVIPGKNPMALLKDLALLKSGRTPSGAIRFSTHRLSILSQQGREIPVFGDGEILLQHERLHFEMHPRALSVFSDSPERRPQ